MKNLDTENLISRLADDKLVSKKYSPFKSFAIWSILSAAYIVLLIWYFAMRPDIEMVLKNKLFIIELISLILIILLSSLSCAYLAIPDFKQNKIVIYLPLIPIVGLIIVCIYSYFFEMPYMGNDGHDGILCMSCVVLTSLIPASLLFYEIRKAAPVKLMLAGVMCLIYAASIGGFILRVIEPEDSLFHIMAWHYLPVVILALIGGFIGNRILKW